MASIVTIAPVTSINSNKAGIAVISLEWSSTLTCPQINLCSAAHAVTRCKAFRPPSRS